jgi:hypothetical protein
MCVGLRMKNMLPAIELYDQTLLRATEIHDEPSDGILATKLETVQLSAPQAKPERTFCVGLPTPESPSV